MALKNLLLGSWTLEEIESCLTKRQRGLLPPYGSSLWEKVVSSPNTAPWKDSICQKVKEEISQPFPQITDALFQTILNNGEMDEYARIIERRFKRIADVSMALLLLPPTHPLHKDLVRLHVEMLTDVLDQKAWNNPAFLQHVGMDLLVVRTAQLLTDSVEIFDSLLPADFTCRVKDRLTKDVIDAYLLNHNQYWWTKSDANWNSVCHQGVIGPALALLDDNKKLAQLLLHASQYLRIYLDGYSADGGCTEGPGYWEYGFLHFAMLNRQIEYYTGNELSLFAENPKIQKIAHFGVNTTLQNGFIVDFADCPPAMRFSPALYAYLGERLNDDQLKAASRQTYRYFITNGIWWNPNWMELRYLVELFLFCPEHILDTRLQTGNAYYPNLGIYVARFTDHHTHNWEFAVKGGHNAESHNHNDCGHYLLHIDGERLLVDLGAPQYLKEFFGPNRYDSFAASSLGHSLPVINGFKQCSGRNFSANLQVCTDTALQTKIIIDAETAYPVAAACDQFKRQILIEKKSAAITVTDYFKLSLHNSLEDAIISILPITITNQSALIDSGKIKLYLYPLPQTIFEQVEQYAFQPRHGTKTQAYRLVLRPRQLGSECELGFRASLQSISASGTGGSPIGATV